jgi:hypothetical protein
MACRAGKSSRSGTAASVTRGPPPQVHQKPAPAGGGAGAGRGLWPPAGQGSAGRCGRGDGPCQSDWASPMVRNTAPRGGGKAPRFPARAVRCHQDPCHPHQQRPAPDRAGEKRPSGAGRALAGGFGPPADQGSAGHCGRGDGPCHGNDAVPSPLRAGPGNAPCFPRPRATLPPRPVQPVQRKASARPGGRDAPAGGGAGAGRGFGPPAGLGSA